MTGTLHAAGARRPPTCAADDGDRRCHDVARPDDPTAVHPAAPRPLRGRDERRRRARSPSSPRAASGHGVARTLVGEPASARRRCSTRSCAGAPAEAPTLRRRADQGPRGRGRDGVVRARRAARRVPRPHRRPAAGARRGHPRRPRPVGRRRRRSSRSPSPSPPATCSPRPPRTAPILVVVDDLPWIDLPSRLVLAYVADHARASSAWRCSPPAAARPTATPTSARVDRARRAARRGRRRSCSSTPA